MRAFVALELPATLRRELADRLERVEPELPRARWVRSESYHLTLRFLGEIEPAAAQSVDEPLRRAFGESPTLTLRLGHGGCFPPKRPARVAWLSLATAETGSAEPLRSLQERVARATDETLGLEPERRPFTPHVTVARCRRPWPRGAVDRFEETMAGGVGAPFSVTSGSLMESRLGAGGARYERLAAYPLGGDICSGGGGDA